MPRISAADAGGENVRAFLDLIAWSEGTEKDLSTLTIEQLAALAQTAPAV